MDASAATDGGVPAAVMQNRHMPRRAAASQSRRRSFNHAVRASAKRLAAQAHDAGADRPDSADGKDKDGKDKDKDGGNGCTTARPQLEAELRRQWGAARQTPRLRCRHRPAANGDGRDLDEAAEGRDLAQSEVPLPSDRFRLLRRPTLEREDAFRDASTASSPRGGGKIRLRPSDNDAQVAELYQMGLLYDEKDEQRDGADAALSLNSIQHDQPVYSIRPDRRARKLPAKAKAPACARDRALRLDLSFSDLGDDNTIAQYLAQPADAAHGAADDDAARGPARPQAYPPLRVIYELAGGRPAFEVETSQPPDLVTDLISDYDCFSDSELDDVPSQKVVHDAGDWVMLGDDA